MGLRMSWDGSSLIPAAKHIVHWAHLLSSLLVHVFERSHQKKPFKIYSQGSSHRGAAETNLTSIHEVAGLILRLAQWVKDPALP